MRLRTTATLLIAFAGCSGASGDTEPRPIPNKETLCYVWSGVVPDNQFELRVYGTLSTDVIAAWGQPTERKGDVWTYEWCIGDCSRKASATLTFEQIDDLCYAGSKKISGLWLADIEAEGASGGPCWSGSSRNREPTCDGCLNKGEVSECLR